MRTAVIAGEGQLPVEIAKKLRADGAVPVALCICSDPWKMQGIADPVLVLPKLKLSLGLKLLKENDVSSVIMAGKVPKKSIYSPSVLFDPVSIKILKNAGRDDHSLLGGIVKWFESEGINVLSYTRYLERSLAYEGKMSAREPDEDEMNDIVYGEKVLKEILPLSFGQSLVVADGAVVAVEAMEGTDNMIARAGSLVKKGTLVKMMRVDQDERYDMPTIGAETIYNMAKAGLTCLAIESERTVILGIDEVCKAAQKQNIAVWGLSRQ